MVMTFVLHPLSHYYTIIEPHARFLLSLIKGLTIDFPLRFILSLMDVYKDTTTRDKLIFPSAIIKLLCHFSVVYPESPHFSFICVIDATTVKWSFAQLRLRQTQTQMIALPTPSTPSTSALSSFAGGATLDAIMAQLQCECSS